MDRKTDIINMSDPGKGGVNPFDNPQLKPGAKDSLSGENQLTPFAPSASVQSVAGKPGGMKKV